MQHAGTWLTVAALTLTAGCAGGNCGHIVRTQKQPTAAWYVESPTRPTPAILFDRAQPPAPRPGAYPFTAQDFAYRSNWPSTPGYYSGGEAVFYREWYYSDQGDDFNNLDYVTRQFQSYRYGTKFR